MRSFLKYSLITLLSCTYVSAQSAESVKEMFSKAKPSGQVRLGYYSQDPDASGKTSTATAIGAQLKLKSASLNGISFGAAMYTAQTIDALSGSQKDGDYSDYLASSKENYTEVAEAYINYATGNFNIRVGRQLIDTPLADSDDIAMTPHTFEAALATYEFSDIGLTFLVANLQRWQGIDSDYENVINNSWADTGDDSTNVAAILYTNETIEACAWHYDIEGMAKATYADAFLNIPLYDAKLSLGAQYLSQSEEKNSGVDGSIAGVMLKATYGGLNMMAAYNVLKEDNAKDIFEGFGGGSSFTNMQTTTAGSIGEDGRSYVAGLRYEFSDIDIFAAYGDYKANNTNSFHVDELDIGILYEYIDSEADFSLIYVDIDDKINSGTADQGGKEIKFFANYNF